MTPRLPARRTSALIRAALVLACGCAREARHEPTAWIVVDAANADDRSILDLDSATATPESAVVRAIRSGAQLMVGVDPLARSGEIRVEIPGACPLIVPSSELTPGAVEHRRLDRRLEVRPPPHPRDLGYDTPFVLEAVQACPPSSGGTVTWRQVAGPALRDVRTDGSGLRFAARTASLQDVALEPPARGIVPVSQRTSAAIVVEAQWRPARGDASAPVRSRVDLASASRAHGLPNVGVDEGVLLAGSGWAITGAPHDASATLQHSGTLTRLIPDVAGSWTLHDAEGRSLSLRAGRYDETPLDCGRSSCHGPITDAVQTSAMTTALRRLTGNDDGAPVDIACAVACHATGQPGTHDGGFTDVMKGLDVRVAWSSLPRAARRLGGVTCLGCHGPSAIPESSARWAILRADVCATCHDAPPTYGHVAAWRSSRMARSDADSQTRSDTACAQCHTTSGFLASVSQGADNRAPPPDLEPIGIACAACHAPHDTHAARGAASADHLLRDVVLPELLAGLSLPSPTRICVRCHAPLASFASASAGGVRPPQASAAAIWLGRGGVDPQTGARIDAPSVHGAIDGGCIGCHSTGPSDLERGASHSFKVDLSKCAACHPGTIPDSATIDRDLQEQAAAVLAKLVAMKAPASKDRPRHASAFMLSDDRIGRATYDALLVLEDPAAAAHNAPFARALVQAARSAQDGAR